MNLTKTLRADLLEAVMKDQFSQEFETFNKEVITTLQAFAKTLDNGLYKKLEKAILKEMPEARASDHLRYSTSVGATAKKDPRNWHTGFEQSVYNSLDGSKLFEVSFKASVPPIVVKTSVFTISEHPSTLVPLKDKADELIKRTEDTMSDLRDVLLSVRTVKQLKEITQVFDPFLPKQAVVGALLPAEALCRVNLLKSPKTNKQAQTEAVA